MRDATIERARDSVICITWCAHTTLVIQPCTRFAWVWLYKLKPSFLLMSLLLQCVTTNDRARVNSTTPPTSREPVAFRIRVYAASDSWMRRRCVRHEILANTEHSRTWTKHEYLYIHEYAACTRRFTTKTVARVRLRVSLSTQLKTRRNVQYINIQNVLHILNVCEHVVWFDLC